MRTNKYGGICDNKGGGGDRVLWKTKVCQLGWGHKENPARRNHYISQCLCGYILPHSLISVNDTLFPKDCEKAHRRPQRKQVIVRQKQHIHVNPPNFQTFFKYLLLNILFQKQHCQKHNSKQFQSFSFSCTLSSYSMLCHQVFQAFV